MITTIDYKKKFEETTSKNKASEFIYGTYVAVGTAKFHKNLTINIDGLWLYGTHVEFDDGNAQMYVYNGTTLVGRLDIGEVVETYNKKIED